MQVIFIDYLREVHYLRDSGEVVTDPALELPCNHLNAVAHPAPVIDDLIGDALYAT